MRTEVVFVPLLSIRKSVALLKDELLRGCVFKFVFDFWANALTDEIYMLVCVAAAHAEHAHIHSILCEIVKKLPDKGAKIATNPHVLGGGYLKMEGDKIIFYDASQKYGVYNKEYLAARREDLAQIFNVTRDEILFQ